MKKHKCSLAVLLSLVCMLSLFGCMGSKVRLVEGSLDYRINFDEAFEIVTADISFDLHTPMKPNYEVTYEVSYKIRLYYEGEEIASKVKAAEFVAEKSTRRININWTVYPEDYLGYIYESSDLSIRVTDVKAKAHLERKAGAGSSDDSEDSDSPADTVKKKLPKYSGIAIGFGVLGGVVFNAMVALFVVLKITELEEEKKNGKGKK